MSANQQVKGLAVANPLGIADFGDDVLLCGYSIQAGVRFLIDGVCEGVSSGILEGTLNEESLAFFGLI